MVNGEGFNEIKIISQSIDFLSITGFLIKTPDQMWEVLIIKIDQYWQNSSYYLHLSWTIMNCL